MLRLNGYQPSVVAKMLLVEPKAPILQNHPLTVVEEVLDHGPWTSPKIPEVFKRWI